MPSANSRHNSIQVDRDYAALTLAYAKMEVRKAKNPVLVAVLMERLRLSLREASYLTCTDLRQVKYVQYQLAFRYLRMSDLSILEAQEGSNGNG